MQITSVRPVKPPMLPTTNNICMVCRAEAETHRVWLDHQTSMRIGQGCLVFLTPEEWFEIMKERRG